MGVNDEGGDEAAAAATAHHVPPSVKTRRLYYYYPLRKVAMDGGAREMRRGSDGICPAASFHIQEIFFPSLQFSGTGNSMKRREIIKVFFSYLWIG